MSASWSGPVQTLNHFIETLPLLVWRANRNGSWLWASPQWQRFTGQSERDYMGDGWLDAVHPDDRAAAQAAWHNAPASGSFEVEFRLLNVAQDRYFWHKTSAGPVFDDAGAILEWLGTSSDIDDLKRLREHERGLLSELQHRVRNMLGVIRALARRTAGHSATMEDFVMRFDGRLNSFARTQLLSTRSPSGKVDLCDLVFDELLLHHMQDERRTQAHGPHVLLGVKASDLFGLAIHELVSHTVMYGALSGDRGKVTIAWRIEEDGERPMLCFSWREQLPPGSRPEGALDNLERDFLERTLRYELDAETSLSITENMLGYEVRLPLKQAQDDRTQV